MTPDDVAPPLSIRLFGPFEVCGSGQPLPRLRFRKSQAILALLALRSGGAVERDWLAGLLWPDTAPAAALHSLRNCLTDLRRALGSEARRLCSPTPRTLALDLAGVSVDVLAFDAALARADPDSLAAAVDLYRGPLLEGYGDEWAFPEREAREQSYLTALDQLAALALARGDAAEAERYVRQAVAADPLRETAQRTLMAGLAAGGNYAAALLVYRELRQRLHRDLNSEPDPETRALFQRLRAEARRTASGLRGTGAERRKGGEGARKRLDTGSPLEAPASDAVGRPLAPSPPLFTAETPRTTEGRRVRRFQKVFRCGPQRLSAPPRWSGGSAVETPAEGENRLVTVLFADMSHSVEVTEGLLPEDAAVLVNRLLSIMVDAILKFGGQVDRFLGDGVLAIFGLPHAHEDDAERAIRAALEIREAAGRLGHPVTAGISTGTVYAGTVGTERYRENSVVGLVVNLASRLQDQASPGQILVGRETYRQTQRAFEFSPLSLAIKGLAEPVSAYAVTGAPPRPEKTRGIEGLRSELVGRDEELARLKAAVSQVAQGRGQMVSLIGEAGVGKSRLVAELRSGVQEESKSGLERLNARTPERLLWLEGRCLELNTAAGYSVFVDLFRNYFAWLPEEAERRRSGSRARGECLAESLRELLAGGELAREQVEEMGPLLGHLLSARFDTDWDARLLNAQPEQIQHQTFLAVRDFLIALSSLQPLLLVLEDLHWADSLSLNLISLLMESLPRASIGLLCVYRPSADPGPRMPALTPIDGQKCAEHSMEIRLRELTPEQSGQLLGSLLPVERLPDSVREQMLEKSRGNPFFLEELARSLIDARLVYHDGERWRARDEVWTPAVPESVQSLILSRFDRLRPDLQRLLQSAAVIGSVFQSCLLERVGVSAGLWPVAGSEADPSHLAALLRELEDQGLVYEEQAVPEAHYSFKHVLVQGNRPGRQEYWSDGANQSA